MTFTRKKFVTLLMALIIGISLTNSPVQAADLDSSQSFEITTSTKSSNENISLLVNYPLSNKSGLLANDSVLYTFDISYYSTYTLTLAVNQIEGSGGIWIMLEKINGPTYLDTVVYSRYQNRFELPAGTYRLRLTSAPGTCSYGVSVMETF